MPRRPLLRPLAAAGLLLALAALTGCGDGKVKTYPVRGQVQYNGQPLKGIDIAFHAVDPKNDIGYPPHAVTDENGNFVLGGYLKDDGAPAGDFLVALAFVAQVGDEGDDQSKRLPGQVPDKYTRKESSGIKVTVKPEENVLDPIKLEGPPLPKRR